MSYKNKTIITKYNFIHVNERTKKNNYILKIKLGIWNKKIDTSGVVYVKKNIIQNII